MNTQPAMPYAEKKRRGEAIYHAQIRPLISAGDADKFVKIDVLTGDYEIGDDSIATGRKLRAPPGCRHPHDAGAPHARLAAA